MDTFKFERMIDNFGEEFARENYNIQFGNFLKSIATSATRIIAPEDFPRDQLKSIGNETGTTINSLSDEIVKEYVEIDNNGINDARKIVTPSTFVETISKTLAEHIDSEWDSRKTVLMTRYEKMTGTSGQANMSEEDYNEIKKFALSKEFVSPEVADNLNMMIKHIMTTEGVGVIEEIKEEIIEDIEKTDAKNAIVRDVIVTINEKKQDIEDEINEKYSEDETESDGMSEESFKHFPVAKFIETFKKQTTKELSGENLSFDLLSLEDINSIRSDFSKLEAGSSNIDENAMSTSDNEEDGKEDGSLDGEEASTEFNFDDGYDNDDYYSSDDEIEIDEGKFKYDEEDEILPEEISEESYAKAILPLSLTKFSTQETNVDYKKLAVLLASSKDRGAEFFANVQMRSEEIQNMISKEDFEVVESTGIQQKLDETCKKLDSCRKDVDVVMEQMGILGIFENKFQLTEDVSSNAVKKILFPGAKDIKATLKGDKAASVESVEETKLSAGMNLKNKEYIQILNLGIKASGIKTNIANGLDVIGNREQLGFIEELINEKLFKMDPSEKIDITDKLSALASLESFMSLEDFADMQQKMRGVPKQIRNEIEDLKDIEKYGYSYDTLVNDIKTSIKSKYDVEVNKYDIDCDSVINGVLETIDVTDISPSIFEKIIVKLVSENGDNIKNSFESLMIQNKGRAILSTVVTANKLDLLSSVSKTQLINQYIGYNHL